MARNKLTDLNNHLFAALERLNDEETKGDNLTEEIERAKAITGLAKEITGIAKVSLDAAKLIYGCDISDKYLPESLKEASTQVLGDGK